VGREALPLLVALALPLAMPDAARGQTAGASPPRWSVAVSVGTIGVTDLQTQPVRADRLDEAGDVVESAVLGRTVTGGSGRGASATVALRLSPAWALRVGAGAGTLSLGHEFTDAPAWAADAGEIPVAEESEVGIVSWDAALRYRIPMDHALRPYLEVGVATERWRSGVVLPAGAGNIQALRRIGGHAAVGGDYPLTDRLALGVRAATRVFRTPLSPLVTGTEIGRTDSLVLTAEAPAAARFADAAVEMVRALRLDVGLSYRAGSAAAPRPDRSEPDASISALRR
jgi:hypothetical protein